MQNLPHVNAQASSQSERANSSNSTANPYDRLSPNAESFERRFSSVLASLKTRLGDFTDKKRSDTFKQSMQDSQKLAQERSDQARELRNQKEEQEEQERKLRAQREAAQDRAEHAQALKVLAQQAQTQATQEQQQAQQSQQALQAQQEASNRELRPSEILAAAYAAQSGAAATATASGAATSIASGAATTAASGAATLSLSAATTLSSGSATGTNSFATVGSASGAGTGTSTQGLASAASGAAATTVANATVASGAATTTTTDGSVSGSGVTSIAGQADAASGNGSGAGNGAGNGNAALSATNAAYGADDAAPNAQAAAQMLQVDGVETTDRAISSSLNALNQHQLGNMDSQEQKLTTAQQIAQLNREELKESLDVMARKANVSKLSLQMANPAALAQARRDAQMLAGLPTSQDTIAALDVSRLNLMAAQGNGNGSNLAAMAGVVTGNSQSVSQVTALNSGPVETVGRTSTEILMQQHQLQQETHGVVEKQALTAAGRAQQAAQQLQAQVANNASATTNIASATQSQAQATAQANAATPAQAATMAANTAPAAANAATAANAAFAPVPQNMAAQVAATSAAMQSLGADRARAEGSLTQANAATAAKAEKSTVEAENGHFGKAAEALLRLAAKQNADGRFDDATTKLMANTIAENQLLGEVADSEVRSALESLQQNVRGQNEAGAAVGYQNSRLASIMTEGAIREQDLAAAAAGINAQASSSQRLARGAQADDSNTVSAAATLNGEAQGAQLSAAAQAQIAAEQAEAAQVREQAQQELQADISRGFILSSDPSSNAAMIHERVMQMAARNLKHLAVDMEPEGLGKMRVNIDLNDKNDALSVWVAAADPQTRALLRHTLPVLQSSLAQQDIVTQTQVLDLNEIEAEEHAEAAVRASAVAQQRLAAQGGNTTATTEVAAAETAPAQPQRGNAMMSRWSSVHSTTDGQGRLRGV